MRRLGNVRLGDYVIERLGVSYRTAQEWIRVDEALERLPLVSAAFDSGEIGSAKVRLLTRVATGEDEARWVALAKRLDVRGLARAVAERQRADRSGGMEACAGEQVPGPDEQIRGGPPRDGVEEGLSSPGDGAREDGSTADGLVERTGAQDEEERLVALEISVPAWLASSWREAVVLARQLAGAVMSRGECFEMVVAELLGSLKPDVGAAAGVARAQENGGLVPEEPGSAGSAEAGAHVGGTAVPGVAQRNGRAATEESRSARSVVAPAAAQDVDGVPASVPDLPTCARDHREGGGVGVPTSVDGRQRSDLDSHSTGKPDSAGDPMVPGTHDAELPTRAPGSPRVTSASPEACGAEPAPAPDGTRAEARAIDKELRGLMAARQRREWALAERLRGAAMLRSYRLDGFASLEEYVRERLGLSPRGTYRLLALHRTLERLPRLRRKFLSGRVTLRQALVIGSVATVVTERAWIARARSVTLRRLEDEVCFWKHLKDVRPAVWEMLEGYPLPAGIVLVPGRPARLSTSARHLRGEDGDEGGADAGSAAAEAWDRSGSSLSGPNEGGDLPTCARRDVSRRSDLLSAESDLRSPSRDLPTSTRMRGVKLTAEALLKALEDAEGALPLPEHRVCLRLRVEPEVKALWESALAQCRSTVGATIADWEVLALALAAFWKTWDNKETRRQRREHRTIERDGWRCMAPGCWSMGTGRLHEHHIIFKSHGGALTDPRNVLAACTQHHKRLLHEGFIRCSGDAPDNVVWSFGVEDGQEPFLVYHGETRVGGTAA